MKKHGPKTYADFIQLLKDMIPLELRESLPFTIEFEDEVRKLIIPLDIGNSGSLIHLNQPVDYYYWLKKGYAMGYTLVDGKIKPHRFWQKKDVINPVGNEDEVSKSLENITILAPSILYSIKISEIERMAGVYPVARYIVDKFRRLENIRTIKRLKLLNESSQVRYDYFRIEFGDAIEKRISKDLLSSYLGISKATFYGLKKRSIKVLLKMYKDKL